MQGTSKASSWVYWVVAKKPFFNNVLGSLTGLVLCLFWRLGCSLGLSVFVASSGGKASVLEAAVMPDCGGVGVTVR